MWIQCLFAKQFQSVDCRQTFLSTLPSDSFSRHAGVPPLTIGQLRKYYSRTVDQNMLAWCAGLRAIAKSLINSAVPSIARELTCEEARSDGFIRVCVAQDLDGEQLWQCGVSLGVSPSGWLAVCIHAPRRE